jgi:hypothetical protein
MNARKTMIRFLTKSLALIHAFFTPHVASCFRKGLKLGATPPEIGVKFTGGY